MEEVKVKCPSCNTEFSPSESLQHHVNHLLLGERKRLEDDFATKEEQLRKFQQKLKQQEIEIDIAVRKGIAEKEATLKNEIGQKLKSEYLEEVSTLKEELEEKSKLAKDAKHQLVEFERLKRQHEDLKKDLELQFELQLAQEKKHIEESVVHRESQKYEMMLAEERKRLADTRKQLEEARRKAEQGSAQLQGEVQELEIESTLTRQHPNDLLEPVPKGISGGDCVQHVRSDSGQICGTILYESKRTKSFQSSWIQKLREDQQKAGAAATILVTQEMPADTKEEFCIIDGIAICTFKMFPVITILTRKRLIEVHYEQARHANKADKMSLLYNYLTSQEFRMHFEQIVSVFVEMKDGIEKEKRAYERIWKERDKQIDKVLLNAAQVYGSVRGIAGNSVKEIALLELGE